MKNSNILNSRNFLHSWYWLVWQPAVTVEAPETVAQQRQEFLRIAMSLD